MKRDRLVITRAAGRIGSLSLGEFRVLLGFAAFQTYGQIAARLGCSVGSVSTLRERVLDKLQLGSSDQLREFAEPGFAALLEDQKRRKRRDGPGKQWRSLAELEQAIQPTEPNT